MLRACSPNTKGIAREVSKRMKCSLPDNRLALKSKPAILRSKKKQTFRHRWPDGLLF
jgi:hypothetical protein